MGIALPTLPKDRSVAVGDQMLQAETDVAGPPLRLVFWETTTGCNLACVHCRRLLVA